MYNLKLDAEQLEIRDTVRDFVSSEIKPVMLQAERLDVANRALPPKLLGQASQMGLRTLTLSEDLGGAGADALTSCIVAEELGAGDADIAAVLTETSRLAALLFNRAMTSKQRDRFLPNFLADDAYHLAIADREPDTDLRLGVNYHTPTVGKSGVSTSAVKDLGGNWVLNGAKRCVLNAPIAKLFAVLAVIPGRSEHVILLVPANVGGVTVRKYDDAWKHGTCGDVTFEDCHVPGDNLLQGDAIVLLTNADASGRGIPLEQAINVGIARAAFEAARDYARLRVQGGRPIIGHQAIATKLADIVIRLEVARSAVWQAAWASDHPEAIADRSISDLPLATIARVFTSEAMLKATKDAAEIFGAMGVMRDMPLAKYIHDARVCLHDGEGNLDGRLRIAETIADYRRVYRPAMALAGE